MKFTKLLALSALWLVGLSANAADLIERVKPTNADVKQTPVTFQAEEEYLLYNTGAQMFFSQGNSWGTKASGNANVESANRMYFTKYVPEGGEWDGKTFIFKIYSSVRSTSYSWHQCFFDSQTAMFVDHASQPNIYWEVKDMGNNVYRLMAAAANPSIISDGTQFVGRADSIPQDTQNLSDVYDNDNAYPLSPMLTEGEGAYVDWVFYSAAIFGQYDAAMELKAAIEKAEAAGLDEAVVSAAVAVYNNIDATVAELEAQEAALEEALKNNIANASGAKPQDASSWIVNGTFDTIGNFTGWKGTGFGAGGTTSTNAENYNKNFDTYQDITIQYPGVYMVKVNGFYRAGSIGDAYNHFVADDDDSKNVTFYATVGEASAETPVVSIYKGTSTVKPAHGAGTQGTGGYWIPNSMADAEKYMHQDGLYSNQIFIEVPTADATMRIGVKKSKTLSTDWAIFDDFTLTFFGQKDDSYQGLLNALIDCRYTDFNIADNTLYTQDYLDTYETVRLNRTATNAEEVEAVLAEIEVAYKNVQTNLNLWADYETTMATIKELTANQEYASKADFEGDTDFANAFWDMIDYYEENYPEVVKNQALNNEELEAEIAMIEEMISTFQDAVKNDIQKGDDVTRFLTNADFEQGNTGWLGASSITAFNAGAAEAYEKNPFDLYQTVKGLKPGVYSISLQGFYRLGANDTAYSNYKNAKKNGTPLSPVAWVYLNENKTPLNNVYDIEGQIATNDFFSTELVGPAAYAGTDDDGNTWYFPNGMSTSHDCFEAGMYEKSAYGLIRKGEEMRVGIKGNLGGSQWAIWDNFKLTYEGYEFETIKPLLEEAIADINAQVKALDDAAAEGEQTLGKTVRDSVATVNAAATEALANGDGEAAFDVLSEALALKDKVSASAALFVQLLDALGQLESAIDEAVNESYAVETNIWYSEVMDKMGAGLYEDADVEALLQEIADRKIRLAQPDPAIVDDDNWVDVTGVIVNPDYEVSTGWSGSSSSVSESCAEIFNADFDYYQDLKSLNEGTYEVRVQGFYRAGTSVNDYTTYVENPDSKNYAFIYAFASDSVVSSIPMKRLASEAEVGDSLSLPSGYTFASAPADSVSTGYYVANTMATAQIEFQNGKYKNEGLFVKVAEDGDLRIGIKKSVNIDQNWTIWDSWQLIYYGKNSANAITEDASAGINNGVAEVIKVNVEYFTLDGRKAFRAQKGILIQKTTLSNGTVEVRKVRR